MSVYWDELLEQLTLRAKRYTVENTAFNVTVAESCGIRLPIAGIRRNDPRYTRQLNAAGGTILADSIDSVQTVGSLTFTPTLSFTDPLAGEETEITLTFTPKMEIRAGEHITLFLPGFEAEDGEINVTSSTDPFAFSRAMWQQKSPVTELAEFVEEQEYVLTT